MHDKEKKKNKTVNYDRIPVGGREHHKRFYIKGTKLKGRQLLQRERTIHLPLIYLADAEGGVEYQKALCKVYMFVISSSILYIYSYFFTFIPKTSKSMQ